MLHVTNIFLNLYRCTYPSENQKRQYFLELAFLYWYNEKSNEAMKIGDDPLDLLDQQIKPLKLTLRTSFMRYYVRLRNFETNAAAY